MQPIPLYPQIVALSDHINRCEHKWELNVKNATHFPITHHSQNGMKMSLRWALH